MRDRQPMLTVAEARERMLESLSPLEAVRVPLLDALDYALAEDIVATEDNPPFDNSAMDGFAVRVDDLRGASEGSPVRLRVVESLPAGFAPNVAVVQGTASRIMTGAMMPEGADAVVMVEHTRSGEDWVDVFEEPRSRQNVRFAGESVRRGDTVLRKGKLVRPSELAMLAALNVPFPLVARKPRVAVISTGDELTPLGQPLLPGKIRDSNRYGLIGQIREAGAEPLDLGIATDDASVVEHKIREAVAQSDALVTSGGVSVGDYDVVKSVLESLGELRFWRVAMKPGKPQAFGEVLGKPVFALPGNPVSSMVVFELFVRPALRKMAGRSDPFRSPRYAIMDESVTNDSHGRTNFMRVILTERNGELRATTTGSQGSGVLKSLVLANGLAVIDGSGASLGDRVEVIVTGDIQRADHSTI